MDTLGTVFAVIIAGVLIYLRLRPRVDAINRGVQQAPSSQGTAAPGNGRSVLLVLGALLALSNGATLLMGSARSESAILYWAGFFGGLALLYRGFTLKAQPGSSTVVDPAQSVQEGDDVPARQEGPDAGSS